MEWSHWHYKNTGLLLLSLVVFFLLADIPPVKGAINLLGNFGYVGAFITGILFVSIFTVAPASVALFYLAESLDPLMLAVAAGAGSVAGDYLIFRYLKDKVFEELKPLFMNHGGKPIRKLFKTPYFAWIVPILGAIIVASPLPDEVGIGLMGLAKIQIWKFIVLTFILDAAGIFLIITAAKFF